MLTVTTRTNHAFRRSPIREPQAKRLAGAAPNGTATSVQCGAFHARLHAMHFSGQKSGTKFRVGPESQNGKAPLSRGFCEAPLPGFESAEFGPASCPPRRRGARSRDGLRAPVTFLSALCSKMRAFSRRPKQNAISPIQEAWSRSRQPSAACSGGTRPVSSDLGVMEPPGCRTRPGLSLKWGSVANCPRNYVALELREAAFGPPFSLRWLVAPRRCRISAFTTAGGQGKSGEKPARSRHCDRAMRPRQGHWGVLDSLGRRLG